MKMGILGSGHVGQTLARGLKAVGHDVVIGSRTGDRLADFCAQTGIPERTFAGAIDGADVAVVALKGLVAEDTIRALADALAGKLVLDTTNPIAEGPPVDGIVPYFTGAQDSLLQRLQKAAPRARFVKCFNSVGAHLMCQPKLAVRPAMFICGDDASAKATTAEIVASLGWTAEDVGGSSAGHAVEALCQLCCAPGFLRNDWNHAFALLR